MSKSQSGLDSKPASELELKQKADAGTDGEFVLDVYTEESAVTALAIGRTQRLSRIGTKSKAPLVEELAVELEKTGREEEELKDERLSFEYEKQLLHNYLENEKAKASSDIVKEEV